MVLSQSQAKLPVHYAISPINSAPSTSNTTPEAPVGMCRAASLGTSSRLQMKLLLRRPLCCLTNITAASEHHACACAGQQPQEHHVGLHHAYSGGSTGAHRSHQSSRSPSRHVGRTDHLQREQSSSGGVGPLLREPSGSSLSRPPARSSQAVGQAHVPAAAHRSTAQHKAPVKQSSLAVGMDPEVAPEPAVPHRAPSASAAAEMKPLPQAPMGLLQLNRPSMAALRGTGPELAATPQGVHASQAGVGASAGAGGSAAGGAQAQALPQPPAQLPQALGGSGGLGSPRDSHGSSLDRSESAMLKRQRRTGFGQGLGSRKDSGQDSLSGRRSQPDAEHQEVSTLQLDEAAAAAEAWAAAAAGAAAASDQQQQPPPPPPPLAEVQAGPGMANMAEEGVAAAVQAVPAAALEPEPAPVRPEGWPSEADLSQLLKTSEVSQQTAIPAGRAAADAVLHN